MRQAKGFKARLEGLMRAPPPPPPSFGSIWGTEGGGEPSSTPPPQFANIWGAQAMEGGEQDRTLNPLNPQPSTLNQSPLPLNPKP